MNFRNDQKERGSEKRTLLVAINLKLNERLTKRSDKIWFYTEVVLVAVVVVVVLLFEVDVNLGIVT